MLDSCGAAADYGPLSLTCSGSANHDGHDDWVALAAGCQWHGYGFPPRTIAPGPAADGRQARPRPQRAAARPGALSAAAPQPATMANLGRGSGERRPGRGAAAAPDRRRPGRSAGAAANRILAA